MTNHQLINTKLIKDKINAIYGNTMSVSVTKKKLTDHSEIMVKVLESTIPMRNPDFDLSQAVKLIEKRKEIPNGMLKVYSNYTYTFMDGIKQFVHKYYPNTIVWFDIPKEVRK